MLGRGTVGVLIDIVGYVGETVVVLSQREGTRGTVPWDERRGMVPIDEGYKGKGWTRMRRTIEKGGRGDFFRERLRRIEIDKATRI